MAAMRAEWKSIECGIGASLTKVMRTRSPSRTRIVGPGTVPPKVQPSYVTPLAISIVSCVTGMTNSRMRASEAGASAASNAGVVAVRVVVEVDPLDAVGGARPAEGRHQRRWR